MTDFHLPHPLQFLPILYYSRTYGQQILVEIKLATSRECAITVLKSFKTELERHHFIIKQKLPYSKLLGRTVREKYYSEL